MTSEYWLRQSGEALFPKLIWSRPENKQGAGKLLILGGQAQEFNQVAESYAEAENAGAGAVRVILPESTRKATKMLPNLEYAPANSSGSFAQASLAELLEAATWADAVLLAGNMGKNSETSLMLENFIEKYKGLLVIAPAAIHSLTLRASQLFGREEMVIVLGFNELQRYAADLGIEVPLLSTFTNEALAAWLHELTEQRPAHLLMSHEGHIWNAGGGKVASTKPKKEKSAGSLAAAAAVWTMQHHTKTFEAITTANYC